MKESAGTNVRKKDNSCDSSGGVCKRACRSPLPEGQCPGEQVCCIQRKKLAKGGNGNNQAGRNEKKGANKRPFRQQKGEGNKKEKATDKKDRSKSNKKTMSKQKQMKRQNKKMKKYDRKADKQQQKKIEKKQQKDRMTQKQNGKQKPKGTNSNKKETIGGRKVTKIKPAITKDHRKEPQAEGQRSGKVTLKNTDGEKRICKKTLKECRDQGGKCVETGTCTTQTLEGGCKGFSCECCLVAGI